jgi:hypothetical protein
MYGHSPIESNKDRKVRVYADNTAVSASTAQSEYARYLNFIGDRFTAVSNTVSGVKTYDIALKYADKIIPYEAGVAKGSTPGYLNFDGDHFDVSSLASQMYTVTSTGRTIPYEAGSAKGIPGFINFDGTHFDVSTIASNQYTVTLPNHADYLLNDQVTLFNNGTQVGAQPGKINLSTAFTSTYDSGNDRFDIGLASGSSGGIIPSPSGLVRGGIRDLSVPFGDGLFNMPHNYADGEASGGNNNTHGHFRRYSVDDVDNSLLGVTTDFSTTQLAFNPHLYGKMNINNLDDSRCILGWASAEPPADNNTFMNGLSGFMIGFQNDTAETEDTTWQIMRNDGSGSETKVSTGISMTPGNTFTFELVGDTANNRWGWNVNGGSFTYYTQGATGNSPATATNLRWMFRMETIGGDAGSLELDIYYLYLLQDK